MRGGLLMIHPEDRGRETVRSAPNQTDPRTGMPDPKRAARAPAAPRGTEAVTEPIAIGPTILRSVKAFVLMACTLTLGVAFAAYAHSEDQHEIEAAAAAAVRFLEMLEPAQARVAVLPPASPLIANWSNLPARITRFERNGVRAGDLGDTQRAALFDFLSAALSREGGDLVQGVIAAEGILSDTSRAS